jgi:hypothetical protein
MGRRKFGLKRRKEGTGWQLVNMRPVPEGGSPSRGHSGENQSICFRLCRPPSESDFRSPYRPHHNPPMSRGHQNPSSLRLILQRPWLNGLFRSSTPRTLLSRLPLPLIIALLLFIRGPK